MPPSPQQANGDWVGLIVILAALIFKAVGALRRGKIEPMPIPGTSLPRKYPPRSPQPAATAARREPASSPRPWETPVPQPPARPAPLPDFLSTIRLPQPIAAPETLPPEPTEAELRALAEREIAAEAAAEAARAPHPTLAARLGLDNLDAWRRAVVASEILQKPLALR